MYRPIFFLLCATFLLISCGPKIVEPPQSKMVIAFGSCNRHDLKNVFWDDILVHNPEVFIWGGDNIYADTDDIGKIQKMYRAQNKIPAYAKLKRKVFVTGTWDDHDYGLNDGGLEFSAKKESQQVFLDFMDVPKNSPRRAQEGVYVSQTVSNDRGSIKIIILDTRYFRSRLTPSSDEHKRYEINRDPQSTILGAAQWGWLEEELQNSTADFNLLVTSIQLLSEEHGFEKWANFPHELQKMKELVAQSGARGVIFLSGDRHISEFSKTRLEGLTFPLMDFTSSGLTHSYSDFTSEPNKHRVGEVVSETSFGLVEFDFDTKEATFKIMGENGKVHQQLKQTY